MRTLSGAILALAIVATPLVARSEGSPGQAVYEKKCASCHGADGRGNPDKAKMMKIDAAKLNLGRDEVASQTRDEKRAITASGKDKMPAYGAKLSAGELDASIDRVMELIAVIRGK